MPIPAVPMDAAIVDTNNRVWKKENNQCQRRKIWRDVAAMVPRMGMILREQRGSGRDTINDLILNRPRIGINGALLKMNGG